MCSEKIKDILKLIRIHNVLLAILGTILGIWISLHRLDLSFKFIVGIFAVGVISAAGFIINDFFDIEIDRINKPDRPLVKGTFDLTKIYRISIILFILGSLLSALINIYCFILALINSMLLYFYSKTLKKKFLIGNLLVAFSTTCSILFGYLMYSLTFSIKILIVLLFCFIFTFVREVVKTIEDYYGDKLHGVNSLPVKLGIKYTVSILVIILLIISSLVTLSFIVFNNLIYIMMMCIVNIIIFLSIYEFLKFYEFETELIKVSKKYRSLYKICMGLGIIAFFF